jgi:hypothetical protein
MRKGMLFSRRVGHLEVLAEAEAQDGGGFTGLFHTEFGRAAGAHVAGGEVESSSDIAHFRHFQQGAAAGLFDVVRVGGEGQHIERGRVVKIE